MNKTPHGGTTLPHGTAGRSRRFSACKVARYVALIAWALLAPGSSRAYATVYTVAKTGSDANSGTAASPWKTINKAASMVSPGDTVMIQPGTYNERVQITRSGTAAAPITFQAGSSTAASIIDGTGTTGSGEPTLVNFVNASYIKIIGLTITNGPGWGINISGNSHHVELNSLDVSKCVQNAIWIWPTNTTPNYTIVRKSKVHDNQAGGIAVWAAPGGYFLIEDNQAYNNTGNGNYDGIQVGGGDGATHHVVVRRNSAWSNGVGVQGADQIDLGGHGIGDHYLVEDNQARGPGGIMKVHQGGYGGGRGVIARRNQLTGIGFIVYGFPNPVMYYNNTIVGGGNGLQIWDDRADSAPGRSLGGMEWRNNLVLEAPDYLFMLNGVSGFLIDIRSSSIVLANNMYKFTGKGIGWYPRIFNAQFADPTGASEFAAYQAANSPNLQDAGSKRITAALTSVFVDPTNRDYTLKAGSPAIDAGGPLTKTTNSGSSAKTISVVKADFFQDGYGGLVQGDMIQVGSNPPVLVTAVNETAQTITVATAISWNNGDPVSLPYDGAAPDAGASEYQSGPPTPTLLSVEPVS